MNIAILLFAVSAAAAPLDWPAVTRETKPWTYNWWLGSAVDKDNLTKELTRYRDAGLGGIHIIPIYGVKGGETRDIPYLSPHWMDMLRHTVTEADRLGLGVDMTTGTGWCFGGPNVTANDANITTKDGKTVKPTMKVKRAAPGGEGYMLNPFYADAMSRYLQRFTDVFAKYDGLKPRAMYHDSYEYNCNWSPNLPAEFEKRRGYKLPIADLFGKEENDRIAKIKHDYRETISDMMIEGAWPVWNQWSRDHGFITRDQAHIIYHGCCYSPDDAAWPGWLFYAATEMNPRNAIWRDVPALNAYIARCQSVLQSGQPDNDVLLYWPIHDLWHDAKGLTQNLTVHKREWFYDQPIGAVAKKLWDRGYSFDYISDRQLAVLTGKHTIVVPPCKHMPAATKRTLDKLAAAGSTVIYQDKTPNIDEALEKAEIEYEFLVLRQT